MPKKNLQKDNLKSAKDKRKRCIYLPYEILEQMEHEAKRNNKGLSWMIQQAWIIAHPKLEQIPGIGEI